MNILITGANGFVGKVICQTLFKTNHQVITLSRSPVTSNTKNHLVLNTFDSKTDFSQALKEIDIVIHLAGRAHVLNEESESPYKAYAEINIGATKNLAMQAANIGVKRFIFISSVKVNGEATNTSPYNELNRPTPEDDYGKSKLEAELVLLEVANKTHMEVVIIRPPLIYGSGVKANFKNLIKLCKSKLPLPFGAIHNKRSMVYVENLIDLIILCMNHPKAANEIFLISDDEDVSTNKLIRTIRKSFGMPSLLVPIPQSWLVFFLSVIGKKNLAKRLCGNLQVDISKAKNLLGWKPPFTFEQGIQRTIKEN